MEFLKIIRPAIMLKKISLIFLSITLLQSLILTQALGNAPSGNKGADSLKTAKRSSLKANAGPDRILEQENRSGTSIILNGVAEVEQGALADSKDLIYIWEGPFGLIKRRSPNVTLPAGKNEISLTVQNGDAISAPDKAVITIQDTVAPQILMPSDPVFFASGLKVPLVLSKPIVKDRIGPVSLTRDGPKDFLPVDSKTVITWTAVDAAGNRSTAKQTLTVLPFDSTLKVHNVTLGSHNSDHGEDHGHDHSSHSGKGILTIEGKLKTQGASDGINIDREEVIVVFGKNRETLSSGTFKPTDANGFHYHNKPEKGIRDMRILSDGSFTINAERWGEVSKKPKITFFSLKIGNDRGEIYLPLDKNGSLEAHTHSH